MKTEEYDDIRGDVIASLRRYIVDGVCPGGFITAVLENKLNQAFSRADNENAKTIGALTKFCYNRIPAVAWGSKDAPEAWQEYRSDLITREGMEEGRKALDGIWFRAVEGTRFKVIGKTV
ncbi:MAG: hypothetical protein JRC86_00500 [Deltaproteobacteria bacterium]|nr:hypothetical protein [Deltaproteobacteria bacterium]